MTSSSLATSRIGMHSLDNIISHDHVTLLDLVAHIRLQGSASLDTSLLVLEKIPNLAISDNNEIHNDGDLTGLPLSTLFQDECDDTTMTNNYDTLLPPRTTTPTTTTPTLLALHSTGEEEERGGGGESLIKDLKR